MLDEDHLKLIESHGRYLKPENWNVYWEDYDVLEIINRRGRRLKFDKNKENYNDEHYAEC